MIPTTEAVKQPSDLPFSNGKHNNLLQDTPKYIDRGMYAVMGSGFMEPIHTENYFVSSAFNKVRIAHNLAGYSILPAGVDFGAISSHREDLCDAHFGLRIVDHFFRIPYQNRENAIPTPLHMVANKAEGVDMAYIDLVRTNLPLARQLYGHEYTVADTQIVIRFKNGKKVGLKKIRHDTREHRLEDTAKVIDTLKQASSDGGSIQFYTAFLTGRFGKPFGKEYVTVRADIGKMKSHIDTNLLEKLMRLHMEATGGLDIYELKDFFVDHQGASTRIQRFHEAARHYVNDHNLVVLDKLIPTYDEEIKADAHFTHSRDEYFALLARGFVNKIFFT